MTLPGGTIFLNTILLVLATYSVTTIECQTFTSVPAHFYPFGPDFGDGTVPVNDDGGSGELSISIPFPYFDNLHSSLYVNTNGVISFLVEVSQFSPDAFPLGDNRRLIAPFWTDVDTTENSGRVYWRETQDAAILDRCSADVRDAFVDQTRFNAIWALVVTWYNVTHFGGSQSTPVNTFQAVLSTNGRHSFVMFNYGEMNWTSGTASTVSAQAGFNAGDGERYFSIPGSRTADIVDVEHTTNVGLQGRWVFRVDDNSITSGGCNTAGVLAVGPRYASMLGGKRVTVAGPCFDEISHEVFCRIGEVTVPATIIDAYRASVLIPLTLSLDRVNFSMSVDGGVTYNHTGIFWLVDEDDDYQVELVDPAAWTRGGLDETLMIKWNTETLQNSTVDVEFVIFNEQSDGVVTTEGVTLFHGAPNNGQFVLPDRLQYATDLIPATVGAIRVSDTIQSVWSGIHTADWYTYRYTYEVVLRGDNTRRRRKRGLSDLADKFLDAITDFVDETATDIKQAVSHAMTNIKESVFGHFCNDWYEGESANPPDFDDVGPSPCTLDQARVDPNFIPDDACNMRVNLDCTYHPGAYHCVRSARASPNGGSQQACYDLEGRLLSSTNGGGTYDKSHVRGRLWPLVVPYVSHYFKDVLTYDMCCSWSSNCAKYLEVRPTDDCFGYQPPTPAWTAGDPHIRTLDGMHYTFNGLGEYWLLDVGHGSLMMQVRAEQFLQETGPSQATVWTAIVMKASDSDKVQITISERLGLEVLVNGQLASFDDLTSQQYQGVFVQEVIPMKQFLVRFDDSGIVVHVHHNHSIMSFLPVLTPVSKGKTLGLLGVWDDDNTNDFTTPSGTVNPPASSAEYIYYEFGLKWRISEEESLFTYPAGKNYSSYQDPLFVPLFEPESDDPATLQRAQEICGDNTECQFDYIVTGLEDLAISTAVSAQLYNAIREQAQNVVTCGFLEVPENGAGNVTNGPAGAIVVFQCDEGYILTGSHARQCLESGQWSGVTTQCIDEVAEEPAQLSTGATVGIAVAFVVVVAAITAGSVASGYRAQSKNAKQTKSHPTNDTPDHVVGHVPSHTNTVWPVWTGWKWDFVEIPDLPTNIDMIHDAAST